MTLTDFNLFTEDSIGSAKDERLATNPTLLEALTSPKQAQMASKEQMREMALSNYVSIQK